MYNKSWIELFGHGLSLVNLRRFPNFFVVICLTIGITISAVSPSFSAPIRFVFSDSYIPLSWDDHGKMQGVLIDILDETVKKRMGLETRYKGYPWKRAQQIVRSGNADAFVTVPTKARLEYTVCSQEAAITVNVNAFTYINHPRMDELQAVQSYDDLSDFVIIDYLGNDWAKNKFKGMKMVWARDLEASYRFLADKKGDVLVRNTFNFSYYSRHLKLDKRVVKLPTALSSVAFHLCIRKGSKHTKILDQFDQVMRDIHADGTYMELTK